MRPQQFLSGAWKAWVAAIIVGLAAIPQTRELIQLGFDQVSIHPTVAGFIMAVLGYAVVWATKNQRAA